MVLATTCTSCADWGGLGLATASLCPHSTAGQSPKSHVIYFLLLISVRVINVRGFIWG